MSLRRDVRHGLRIGRAEFVRSLRRYVRDRRRLLGLAVAVLFFGGNLLFAIPAAYVLGRTAQSVTAIPYFGLTATALPIGLLLLAALRTLERIGGVDAEDLVLMTVHPRAVVTGLIAAEFTRLSLWIGIPLAVFVAAFAFGLGAPSVFITVGLVVLPLVACMTVWGYAAGIGLLRVLRWLPGVRRVLKVGGVLLLVGIVLGTQFAARALVEDGTSIQGFLSHLAVDPLADYVALAFIGTPLAPPTSLWAPAILVGLVVLTPVGLVVATRQSSLVWFTDEPVRDQEPTRPTSTGGFTAPPPFAWRKAGRVGWSVLVRGARHPQELGHLLILVFVVGPLATGILQAAQSGLGPLIAGVGVGLGTFIAGATFGLNPLGDDRPQLPMLLLTPTAPRTLVRGRVLAGLALGVPFVVLVPIVSVILGTALSTAVTFALVGVGTCLAAALFAVGIGAAYPIYEEREFWGTETVVPSTLVLMVYFAVVGGGTVIGLAVTWLGLAGHLVFTALFAAGFGFYLLLTVGLSYGSYRYAIRRYRRYTME